VPLYHSKPCTVNGYVLLLESAIEVRLMLVEPAVGEVEVIVTEVLLLITATTPELNE
jgi:hypothetical protein